MQVLVFFEQFLDPFADLGRSYASPPLVEFEVFGKLLTAGRRPTGIVRFIDMLELLLDLLDVFHSQFGVSLFAAHAVKDVPRQDIVLELGRILKALDDQEHGTKSQGDADVLDGAADVSLGEGKVGQDDGHAAANQHKGVEGPDPLDQV